MNLPFHFRPTFPTFPTFPALGRVLEPLELSPSLISRVNHGYVHWKKKFVFFSGQKNKKTHGTCLESTIFVSTSWLGNSLGWFDASPERSKPKVDEEIDASFTSMWQNLHIRHEKDNAVNIRYIVCMYRHLCHKHQPTITAGKHCSRWMYHTWMERDLYMYIYMYFSKHIFKHKYIHCTTSFFYQLDYPAVPMKIHFQSLFEIFSKFPKRSSSLSQLLTIFLWRGWNLTQPVEMVKLCCKYLINITWFTLL